MRFDDDELQRRVVRDGEDREGDRVRDRARGEHRAEADAVAEQARERAADEHTNDAGPMSSPDCSTVMPKP